MTAEETHADATPHTLDGVIYPGYISEARDALQMALSWLWMPLYEANEDAPLPQLLSAFTVLDAQVHVPELKPIAEQLEPREARAAYVISLLFGPQITTTILNAAHEEGLNEHQIYLAMIEIAGTSLKQTAAIDGENTEDFRASLKSIYYGLSELAGTRSIE